MCFLNITGGIRVEDPALDLAVCASVISSQEDIALPDKCIFAAEVGLGGEVRAISRIENRIGEAEKLGFEQMWISKYNLKGLDTSKLNINIKPIGRIEDLMEQLFLPEMQKQRG